MVRHKSLFAHKTILKRAVLLGAAIMVLNVLASQFYQRFDLTKEKRFTLSQSTKSLINKLDDEAYITLFLDGELPLEYKRLQSASRDMLNEFKYASGGKIKFKFEDVLDGKELKEKEAILQELYAKGLKIERPEAKPDETPTDKFIIPAGVVYYKGAEYPLNLLKREFGKPLEVEINSSIELLEYEIGTALRKGLAGRELKLAFTAGHGELTDIETADIAATLGEFYEIERINLNLSDSNCYKIFAKDVVANPGKPVFSVLVEGLVKRLQEYSGIIVAKPTIAFTEPEKFVLDQYIMNGGKVIFLVENLVAETDSVAKYGEVSTSNHKHNLEDLLFHYGVKVQNTLVQDIQCHGIPAINQQTNRPDFYPWMYYPLFSSVDDNPVSKNLENVWGRYVSTLDTTAKLSLNKTVLLRSSINSRIAANPVFISLRDLDRKVNKANFSKGNNIAAILVDGEFTSPFRYREGVKRAFDMPYKEGVKNNAIIVIGDGDLIRNQVTKGGQVYPLGYDRFGSKQFGTPIEFANKKFFLNCVDYLCDETNLIEVRSKEIILRLLNKDKVKSERLFWQSVNMIVPILSVVLFGLFNAWYRRRRWK
ncbi:gliding motility-associated ABC transporter substrate-binding protein GldG [Bacteroidia bacterium]|jgi:ABC-2 type transport system permease protein|nr:gliding motility-associated ABC transporter substrate-binding protein GldG [Bacteroidia bacterium]